MASYLSTLAFGKQQYSASRLFIWAEPLACRQCNCTWSSTRNLITFGPPTKRRMCRHHRREDQISNERMNAERIERAHVTQKTPAMPTAVDFQCQLVGRQVSGDCGRTRNVKKIGAIITLENPNSWSAVVLSTGRTLFDILIHEISEFDSYKMLNITI